MSRNSARDISVIDFNSPEIRLGGCSLNAGICEELCRVLTDNDIVSTIDFSRNELGDDGAEHIARLLTVNKGIVSLNLSHNGITDGGVTVLIRAARKHATLQSLNLAGNPLTDASMIEVARLVNVSDQISELVLLDTPITVRGALQLAEAMLPNNSLTLVSLPFNLGFTVLDEVQRILTRNYARITKLDEQVRIAAHASMLKEEADARRRETWKPTQPLAEQRSSRVHTIAAPLGDWADAAQRPTLMYLNLLDRRAKQVEREERQSQNALRSPRGRGGIGSMNLDTVAVAPTATMIPGGSTPRSSRSTATQQSNPNQSARYLSLPPLPETGAGFTASFQTSRRRRF